MPGITITDHSAATEEELAVPTEIVEDEAEPEEEEAGSPEDQEEGEAEPEVASAEDEEGELAISLGEESEDEKDEPQDNTSVLRELRKQHKEQVRARRTQDREIKELKAQLEAARGVPAQAEQLGARPTMGDPDVDYDEDRFQAKLEGWIQRKADADAIKRRQQEEIDRQNKEWESRRDAVTAAARTLKVPDHDDAVESFDATFSPLQRGIIIGGPDDAKQSAQLRYVLGRSPKVAKELAAITDPVKFTFAIVRTLDKMKVTPKKTAPVPERVVRSGTPGTSGNVDKQLEKLREEARKSGDMSAVMKFKAELRKQGKSV